MENLIEESKMMISRRYVGSLILVLSFIMFVVLFTPALGAEGKKEEDISMLVDKLVPSFKGLQITGPTESEKKTFHNLSLEDQPLSSPYFFCDVAYSIIRAGVEETVGIVIRTHHRQLATSKDSLDSLPAVVLTILGRKLAPSRPISHLSFEDHVRKELAVLGIKCSWIPRSYKFEGGGLEELNAYFGKRVGHYLSNVDFSNAPIDSVVLANQFFAKFADLFLKEEGRDEGKESQKDKVVSGHGDPESYLDKAAMRYHPGALRELALLRKDANPDQASNFMHLAAVQGHPAALYDLATAYHSDPSSFNLSTERDLRLAGLFYRAAAKEKHPEAECVIAGAYFKGEFGFPQDPEEGTRQLERLAKEGNKWAAAALKAEKALEDMSETLDDLEGE